MRPLLFKDWIDRSDRRLHLRRLMMQSLGIAGKRDSHVARDLVGPTLLACTSCSREDACEAWLGAQLASSRPPGFCANRHRFQRLMEDAATPGPRV